jgi:hypothetical protein
MTHAAVIDGWAIQTEGKPRRHLAGITLWPGEPEVDRARQTISISGDNGFTVIGRNLMPVNELRARRVAAAVLVQNGRYIGTCDVLWVTRGGMFTQRSFRCSDLGRPRFAWRVTDTGMLAGVG